mgnify:CR=1 FL=1
MRYIIAAVCAILVWVFCSAGLVISADYDSIKPGSYPPYDGVKSDFEFPGSWGNSERGVARFHKRDRGRDHHIRGKLHSKGKLKHVLTGCFNRSCH